MQESRKRYAADGPLPGPHYVAKRPRLTNKHRWINQKAAYKDWLDGEDEASSMLWIQGPPGCGKTFLAQQIFTSLNQAQGKPATACYLCDANTTPADIARSVCDQLSRGRGANDVDGETEQLLLSLQIQEHSTRNQAHTAWDALTSLLNNLPTWTLILDGLNDISPDWLAEQEFSILHRLRQSVEDHRGPSKLCILSTADSRIGEVFDSALQIKIVPSETEDDIKSLIEDRIDKSTLLKSNKEIILESLVARAHGNFQWVTVALDLLAREKSKDSLLQVLENLPDKLNELYAVVLDRQAQNLTAVDLGLRNAICRWKLLSVRDVSESELANAVSVSTNAFIADIRKTVEEACYALIKVGSTEIKPVHHSVRDFFATSVAQSATLSGISGETAHSSIAISCLQYLLRFGDAQDAALPLIEAHDHARNTYPLLEYASLYWPHHVGLGRRNDPKLKALIAEFFSSPVLFAWMDNLLPRFMDATVLPVPPRPRNAAQFAFLISLKAGVLSTFQSVAERNNFDQQISENISSKYEQALSEAVAKYGEFGRPTIARMLDLGDVYSWLSGKRAKSEELITSAFEATRRAEIAKSRDEEDIKLCIRAHQMQADSIKRAGRYEQAKALLETLLHMIESDQRTATEADTRTLDRMFALDSLGWVCMRLELLEESATHLETAVRLATKIHGSTSPHTSRSKVILAEVLVKLGRNEDAEILCMQLIEALEQHRVNGAPLSRDTISQLNVLAAVYTAQRKYAEAVATWEIVVDERTKAFGADHPMALGVTMQLGLAVERAGKENRDASGAIELFEDLLPRQEKVLGAEHPDIKTSREALARLRDDEWLVVEAE